MLSGYLFDYTKVFDFNGSFEEQLGHFDFWSSVAFYCKDTKMVVLGRFLTEVLCKNWWLTWFIKDCFSSSLLAWRRWKVTLFLTGPCKTSIKTTTAIAVDFIVLLVSKYQGEWKEGKSLLGTSFYNEGSNQTVCCNWASIGTWEVLWRYLWITRSYL